MTARMEKNIYSMTNYELGEVAKAFTECGRHIKCADCPCQSVLCGVNNIRGSRDSFVREVAKRLMDTN